MSKLTVKKQSLIDWTVENERGQSLAWITKQKGKAGGRSYDYYEVRYTKNLGIGAEQLVHDFALKFAEAKNAAVLTINNWNNA